MKKRCGDRQRLLSLPFTGFFESFFKKSNNNEDKKKVQNKIGKKTNINRRDNDFSTKDGVVNLHVTKCTPWVLYKVDNQNTSYGYPQTNFLYNFINKGKR